MKRTVLILALLAFLLNSCMHSYYVPNAQIVPFFRQAGDNQVVVSTGSDVDNSVLFDLQGAYALTNHFFMIGSLYSSYQTVNEEYPDDYSTGKLFEVGLGNYEPLGKIGSYDVLVGYGNGSQYHHYDSYSSDWDFDGTGEAIYETGQANLRFHRLFVQSSVGLTTRYVELGVSGRICNVNYYNVHYQLSDQGDEYNTLRTLNGLGTWWFEPAVTLRFGYDPIKLQVQMALNTPLSKTNPNASTLSVNVGLVVRIPQPKKP